MTQHSIYTLSPAELRAYALGMRRASGFVPLPEEGPLGATRFDSTPPGVLLLLSISDACRREAELVEGFAARLDTVEAALAEAQRDQPEEFRISPEDMAELESMLPPSAEEEPAADLGRGFINASRVWRARFEAAAHRTRPSDAETWYQPDGRDALSCFTGTLLGALTHWGVKQGDAIAVISNRWKGKRWATIMPTVEGPFGALLAETPDELAATIAEWEPKIAAADAAPSIEQALDTPTPAETTQSVLADAMAEDPAPQVTPEAPPRTTGRPGGLIWTPEREALLRLLYPTIICSDALFGLASALPGEPIASPQALRQHAAGLGLRRQGLPLPEGYSDQPITDRSPVGMPGHLKATTTPEQPKSMRKDSPWTPEREAKLRELFPTIMKIESIHEILAAMPGQPLNTLHAVRQKAEKLELHRRGEPVPDEYADAATSRTRQPQKAEAQPTSAHSRAENGPKPGTWTAERERVLRRDYPTDKAPGDMLMAVNALPGPPVASIGALYAHAKKIGLVRRQPPAVGPAIAPVVTAKPIELTTEEMHELREQFRRKEFGTTYLTEEWGLSEERARAIVQQFRDEAAKRKAA